MGHFRLVWATWAKSDSPPILGRTIPFRFYRNCPHPHRKKLEHQIVTTIPAYKDRYHMSQGKTARRRFGISDWLVSLIVRNEKIKPDVMLKFYLDLFDTDYLHFGIWEPGDPLDLEHVQAAQERYANRLVSMIPEGVRSILDVGCGVGGNARKLLEAGYEVTALAPDPYQRQLFLERTGGRIPFILSRFEDYQPDRTFDLILMSESVQYQNLDESFPNAYRALNPGGYLLMSDFYRLESASDVQSRDLPSHLLSDVSEKARRYGFELVHEDDITEATVPTLEYGKMVYERYMRPIFRLQLSALQVHLPLIYKLFRLALRVRINGEPMERIIRNHLIPPDPEMYRKHMRYRIHLFRKPVS